MEDLGPPSSYLALGDGTAVYSSDGEKLGKVQRVLADPEVDIFDGIVIDASALAGGDRFVEGAQVDEIYERGLVLKLTAEEAQRLPPAEGAENQD